MERRRFLQSITIGAGVAAATGVISRLWAAEKKKSPLGETAGSAEGTTTTTEFKIKEIRRGDMPMRELGRTGEMVSAIGLGGAHIGHPDEAESLRIMRAAIDGGITFMDNCWDYGEGQSEIRMGKALQDGYRGKVFLMTKYDGRTKEAALKQLEDSLKRLQTDHVDLWQFHENIRMEDPDRFFAKGGAMEAVEEAKKAGKVRYVGFTGHKDPAVHLRMLEAAKAHGFHFDTVQMPINVMDASFRSFQHQVMPVALREGVAILGMKPLGAGMLLKSGTVEATECLRYALSLPVSVVITGIDSMEILKQALEVARGFKPLSRSEMAGLEKKTFEAAASGEYEKFKTDVIFDGTAKNPQWMG